MNLEREKHYQNAVSGGYRNADAKYRQWKNAERIDVDKELKTTIWLIE